MHPESPSADRRRSVRRPLEAECTVRPASACEGQPAMPLRSLNISKHGMGFEADEPLDVGGRYVVEVALGEQRLIGEVLVVRCRLADQSGYDVGAVFT